MLKIKCNLNFSTDFSQNNGKFAERLLTKQFLSTKWTVVPAC